MSYRNEQREGRAGNSAEADVPPRKVYVELTTDCNMDCPMCIRHSWDRPAGTMSAATFERMLEQLKAFPDVSTLNFSGYGEPMVHPAFYDFLARAKGAGFRVEMVTNALGLDAAAVERLIDLELDRIVVSVDAVGASAGSMLHGGSLGRVAGSLRRLYHRRMQRGAQRPEIALEFVASRRNIHELPELRKKAMVLGFTSILVTNLIPHTPALADEILYGRCSTATRRRASSPYNPCVDLPQMDAARHTSAVVERLRGTGTHIRVNGADLAGAGSLCRFVSEGRFALRADGRVSPCLSLMHSHTYYFRGRARRVIAYHTGNVNDTPLVEIWAGGEYRDFRDRVRQFEFSPCIDCGGCDLRGSNERDCTGDVFPRCGECLWAAGLVQCP